MGYELTRFQGDVDEELVCPICSGVLEEPVQVNIIIIIEILWVSCVRVCVCVFPSKREKHVKNSYEI